MEKHVIVGSEEKRKVQSWCESYSDHERVHNRSLLL